VIRVAVLASGRGSNLQALLDAAAAGQIEAQVTLVISDNPQARALERARRHGVEAVVVPRAAFPSREAMEDHIAGLIEARNIDLIVLAGYMRLLGKKFVERFYGRIINIHPSLLPAFPGLEAQRQALEYGVKITGCTVHFVDAGMDTGPIILQAAVPVEENDTVETLAARILEQEHRLLPAAVQLFAAGRLVLEGRRVKILTGAEGREAGR